jgi:hypothetical protein
LRICADENVSPLLSRLIREALLGKGHVLDTVDDHQARSVDDEIWVRKFAKAGGEAIVGGDGRMLTRPHEVVAIAETGLRLVVLAPQWAQQAKHVQISYLFFWWPAIERALSSASPRHCFKVPWSWSPKDSLSPVPLDFQDAYKKLKKARGKD